MEVDCVGDGRQEEGDEGCHSHRGQTDVVELQGSRQSKPNKNLTENSGQESPDEQRCSGEACNLLVVLAGHSGVDVGEVGHLGGCGNTIGDLASFESLILPDSFKQTCIICMAGSP